MMMQSRPTTANNGLLSASPTSVRNAALGRPPSRRPSLPEKNVTESTIEDVYVRFILYCNPAVSPDTDPTALKEAFRVPPKSEGKVFSTFTLYELIGKLMQKTEIKTWGDLALKLGVDPPNQEKGQSSQKIQQYAVRLKRWMKSMHIDAFFDYLYDNPHAYWTHIPPESTLVLEIARDGVAPEDDMALRALLPHIRPRRGRRMREDDDPIKSPSKIPRQESPGGDDYATSRQDHLDPWSAHPDGGNAAMALNTPGGMLPAGPWTSGLNPLAYPRSAITPSTNAAFWVDEPKSAITPSSKSKTGHRRHGPKVVSSAWRSGPGSSGKTRGRPPINRTVNDGSFSAFPSDSSASSASTFRTSPPVMPSPSASRLGIGALSNSIPGGMPPHDTALHHAPLLSPPMAAGPAPAPAPAPLPGPPAPPSLTSPPKTFELPPPQSIPPRGSKPSRLSLQVPKRVGGEVRLATPPPVLMVNGEAASTNGDLMPPIHAQDPPATGVQNPAPLNGSGGGEEVEKNLDSTYATQTADPLKGEFPIPPLPTPPPPASAQGVHFKDPNDRTNMDALEGFFVHEILTANWFDKDGNRIPACGVDEGYAIVKTVIDNLRLAAQTKEGFLINVSALAGGKLLMTTTSLKITLVEVCSDHTKYICDWCLQLGDLKGTYSMNESVKHSLWKRKDPFLDETVTDAHATDTTTDASAATAAAPTSAASATGGSQDRAACLDVPGVKMGAGEGAGGVEEGGRETGGSNKAGDAVNRDPPESTEQSAEYWKERYRELMVMYKKKDRETSRIQAEVMKALRDPRVDRL